MLFIKHLLVFRFLSRFIFVTLFVLNNSTFECCSDVLLYFYFNKRKFLWRKCNSLISGRIFTTIKYTVQVFVFLFLRMDNKIQLKLIFYTLSTKTTNLDVNLNNSMHFSINYYYYYFFIFQVYTVNILISFLWKKNDFQALDAKHIFLWRCFP